MQIPHKLSADEDDCNIFFDKDKQADNSCARLRDSEAEAEAAASAVAVAAISTNEVVVNGLSPVSISDSKKFDGADIGGIPTGRFCCCYCCCCFCSCITFNWLSSLYFIVDLLCIPRYGG